MHQQNAIGAYCDHTLEVNVSQPGVTGPENTRKLPHLLYVRSVSSRVKKY